MLPRESDLTVNKYLSIENDSKPRYLGRNPNTVPWEEGPALIDRSRFFNAVIKKKNRSVVVSNKVNVSYGNSTTTYSFGTTERRFNMTVNTISDDFGDHITIMDNGTINISTTTSLNGNNIYINSKNLYYDMDNRAERECEEIFDDGYHTHLSKLIPWSDEDIYRKLIRYKQKRDSKIPWSDKKMTIKEEMDYLDIEPGEILWKAGSVDLMEYIKSKVVVPWRVDEEMSDLNRSRDFGDRHRIQHRRTITLTL